MWHTVYWTHKVIYLNIYLIESSLHLSPICLFQNIFLHSTDVLTILVDLILDSSCLQTRICLHYITFTVIALFSFIYRCFVFDSVVVISNDKAIITNVVSYTSLMVLFIFSLLISLTTLLKLKLFWTDVDQISFVSFLHFPYWFDHLYVEAQ